MSRSTAAENICRSSRSGVQRSDARFVRSTGAVLTAMRAEGRSDAHLKPIVKDQAASDIPDAAPSTFNTLLQSKVIPIVHTTKHPSDQDTDLILAQDEPGSVFRERQCLNNSYDTNAKLLHLAMPVGA
jgi:hypothetical protein